jgi:hypothetical protein
VDVTRVLPCVVEKRSISTFIDDTVAVDTINVLPCANTNARRFIFIVEPNMVDDALHVLVLMVLPTMVENPPPPTTILETFAVEATSVLPCAVENTIPPRYMVEPFTVDKTTVLP